jgi:FtsP/CotA-like multicopper oxidase with cupredoxin domain
LPEQGLLRLRLVNASPSRIYRLALEEHPLNVVALDGITLTETLEMDELLMSPGQRADVLVKGDRPSGSYSLMTLPYDRGINSMMQGIMGEMGNGRMGSGMMGQQPRHQHMQTFQQTSDRSHVLATVKYTDGVTASATIPATLPVPEKYSGSFLPEPQTRREFIFDHGMDVQTGATFLINGKGFAPNRIDVSVPLDHIEDWVLVNRAGMDHPFHLHGHPFQIISRNGQPEPVAIWRDTVMVKAYETVTIRISFKDYPGKTVYHCHILDHEDKGMMGIVDVG